MIITHLIRMYCMNDQLENAWRASALEIQRPDLRRPSVVTFPIDSRKQHQYGHQVEGDTTETLCLFN